MFKYTILIKYKDGNEVKIVKAFADNAECQKFIKALNPAYYSASRKMIGAK